MQIEANNNTPQEYSQNIRSIQKIYKIERKEIMANVREIKGKEKIVADKGWCILFIPSLTGKILLTP